MTRVSLVVDRLDRDPNVDALLNGHTSAFASTLRAALAAATTTERKHLLGGILHDPARAAGFVDRILGRVLGARGQAIAKVRFRSLERFPRGLDEVPGTT